MIEITGKVIHGDNYGKTLGFPTANLDRRDFTRRNLKIRFGVWSGTGEVRGKRLEVREYKAGIVIGPIDKQGLPKIEAHLIDFKGNLYGKKITISLKKFLRPFKKFKTLEQLKLQIRKDLVKVKK